MKKQLKHESGFAHLMAVLVIVVLAAIGGIGYVVMNKQKDKSSTGSNIVQSAVSNKAITDACNKELNDKDFCKFASNWSQLSNYKTTISSTSAEGTTVMVAETENADKSKVATSTNGKEAAAYVTLGKDFYTKDEADNTWTKFTDDSTTKPVTTNIKDDVKVTDFTNTAETSKTKYKKIGKEPCQNLTCYKYQIIDSTNLKTEQFVWFDTKDFLLRRTTSKSADGSMDMVLSYGNVKVSAPSPVKSSSSSSQSAAEAQKQIDETMKSFQDNTDTTDNSAN